MNTPDTPRPDAPRHDAEAPHDVRALRELAWAELTAAVSDEAHGFHWPVFATVDAAGAPHTRVVVLRAARAGEGVLTFHTDRRAPKSADVRRRADVALNFHDGPRKLQARITAQASVHEEGPWFERGWAAIGRGSRACYLAPHPPSSPADAWSPNRHPDHIRTLPDDALLEQGRARFAVVVCHVTSLDVLKIERHGHRRARFGADGHGAWLHP